MTKVLARVPVDPSSACCAPLPSRRVEELRGYAVRFKALADETRLQMLALLAAAEDATLCVCNLETQFELSQPTISHHLKVLKEAGLVKSERRGSWVYYALDRDALRFLKQFRALLKD